MIEQFVFCFLKTVGTWKFIGSKESDGEDIAWKYKIKLPLTECELSETAFTSLNDIN